MDAALQQDGVTNKYVSLSDEIRQLLLTAFIEGQLVSGSSVNDMEIATKLGVSRTPVREALRGLQTLGIIETLPARVTRVVTLSSKEFQHATAVWSALYQLLLVDAVAFMGDEQFVAMTDLAKRLADPDADDTERATVTFLFFDTLYALTRNSFLRESVRAASYRVRLGYNNSPGPHAYFQLSFAHAQEFIVALRNKDIGSAQKLLVGSLADNREEASDVSRGLATSLS